MKPRSEKNRERGVTIAFVALVLIALLGVAALAVDLGVLYTARNSSQNAADSAALAGAVTFVKDLGKPQPETADGAARVVATQGKILGSPILDAEVTVNTDYVNRRVKVTIARNVTTFFGRVLGLLNADVQTVATAEASEQGSGAARCVKPIFIPNTVLAPETETYTDACERGHVIFDTATGELSEWVKTERPFSALGCDNFVTIRPIDSSAAQQDLAPSQYFSIDFGAGGNTYRCSIASCLNDPACGVDQTILNNYALACNKEVNLPTQTGGLDGPTKQGVDDLLDQGLGGEPDYFKMAEGQIYNDADQKISDSAQDSAVPVWDNCDPGNQIDEGKQAFRVVGLARIFITGYDKGPDPNNSESCTKGGGGPPPGKGGGGGGGINKPGVQAWIRDAFKCGASGEGPTPTQSGPFAIPVRLVQNQ
jgi:hypothetical protein